MSPNIGWKACKASIGSGIFQVHSKPVMFCNCGTLFMVWFEGDLCKERPSPSANAGVCSTVQISVCFTLLNSWLKRCSKSNALDVRISSTTVIKSRLFETSLCLLLCLCLCSGIGQLLCKCLLAQSWHFTGTSL